MLDWLLGKLINRAHRLSARHTELEKDTSSSPEIDAWVREGYGLHTANDLEGASAVYRRILAQRPEHADTLYLLGEIYHTRGDYAEAGRLIQKAIASDPSIGAYYASLADVCKRMGRLADAEKALREAINLEEGKFEYLDELGAVLHELGRDVEALQCFEQALLLNPGVAHELYLYNLGREQRLQGKKEWALECYRRAFTPEFIAEMPAEVVADAVFDYGNLLQELQFYQESIVQFRRALEFDRDLFGVWVNLGNSYNDMKMFEEAQNCQLEAIRINPRCAQAFGNLGIYIKEEEKGERAKQVYSELIKQVPLVTWPELDQADPYYEFEVARVLTEHALSIDPAMADAYLNKGVLLEGNGYFTEGLACFERTLELTPDSPNAHLYQGMALLRMGKLTEGWGGYEGRLRVKGKDVQHAHLEAAPMWRGQPLGAEKCLLIHAEQGLGDTIQFIRYYGQVKSRCQNVIVECPAPLKTLIQSVDGMGAVYSTGSALPKYDYQVPLLSLPGIFETSLENIPLGIPYVHPDPIRAIAWKEEVSRYPGLKVGIVWAGGTAFTGNRFRSCSLDTFVPLAGLEGVCFFSLQKGPPEREADNPPVGMNLLNFSGRLHDFRETAAFVASLDLVIAVDTAVAHLAGAMGKTVWVLIPLCPDWRWMTERQDSPWYPTMRLFRQEKKGVWGDCLERIRNELADLCATGG